MKKLVDENPLYVANGNVHTAKKVTKLISIDPATGEVVSVFGDESMSEFIKEPVLTSENRIFVGRTRMPC